MRTLLVAMVGTGLVVAMLAGCQPQTSYEDPDRVVLVDDKFNDTDLKQFAGKMADSILQFMAKEHPDKKPVVMVNRLDNKTSEHISTKGITDKIITALMQGGKVRVVDETARADVAKEYEYNAGGAVDPKTVKGPGKQTGADYFLRGEILSDTHAGNKQKVQFYMITLKLTDIEKNEIVWQADDEIKKYTKRAKVGM
ncbi:MAG: penicillin-binding protein activator LpoB [Planctomycetota bacterium]